MTFISILSAYSVENESVDDGIFFETIWIKPSSHYQLFTHFTVVVYSMRCDVITKEKKMQIRNNI